MVLRRDLNIPIQPEGTIFCTIQVETKPVTRVGKLFGGPLCIL